MEESQDVQELFFTNLQLLGFNVERKEAEVRIPFNKNMFDLPNRRGAEEVLYFLFSRLNPVMCKEEFRGCWPITDKQQEQMFRRGCNNWLSNINKEEPEAMLPRISPSLFLTPGGAKFYQLIYRFSRYVILQVNEKENGAKEKEKQRYPTLSQKNKELAENMADVLISCVIRKRNTFLNTAQEIVSLNRQWKEQSNDMVKEYRKLNKEIRDTELKIRDEIHKSSQMSAARGSPLAKKQRSKSYEPDFDPKSTKRSQKVNEVRGLWKQLDGFLVSEASEREVIESIVDTSLTKYRIDSANISIKVPDLLLRECEKEIRQVRILFDMLHIIKETINKFVYLSFTLFLNLIQDRFQDTGVPDFTTDIEKITTLAHKNHSLLVASQDLQKEIEGVLPELKRSVDQLRSEVEQGLTTTPTQLRTSAVGLGLMEPTPEVSFSPASTAQGRQPTETSVTLTPHENATPEAVARISEDISVRVNRIKLFSDSPRISQSERTVSSTKLPRKLAVNQKSSTTWQVDRTKPRVVDVRGQLQSTPTKARREQKVNAHIGLKALDLKQDLSLNESDRLSADVSTLVQREQSTLITSTSRNSSAQSTPRKNHSLNNFNNNEPFCDKTPTNKYRTDVKVEQGGSMHSDMNKSATDFLVDEIFGETPKGSPLRVQKSPSDYLVEEVLSSGVLNSPFMDQSQDIDGKHFTEGELKSDIGESKKMLHIEKSVEDLERGLSEINCSGDFTRTDKSAPYLQRPHSPVAEFLDHLEFEPTEKSQGILEKQVDALSDLESSRSSQGLEASDKENVATPAACIASVPEYQNSVLPSFDEEVDVELRQEGIPVPITPSAGIPIIKDSINFQESPLSEDIRKIYREAMGGEESSVGGSNKGQGHPDIFDEFLCTADMHGDLDSVEMPVFSLNDSAEDMEPENQSSVISPPVNSGQNVSGAKDGQKLVNNRSPKVSDLNGNPVHHHLSRGVDRLILDRQLSRTWEQLELSMEVLDDLMGKSPEHQFSPFLQSPQEGFFDQPKKTSFPDSPVCPKPKDNSSEALDTSDDLDESFVPFKDGFSLEGGTTPAKKNTQINLNTDKDGGAGPSSTDDLLARFQKLKQKTSQIVSDGT
ncbi:uncharacterized protein LOC134234321 [Saccostrea cucullata]|uniref:uncharacterized protein LOC134234321 n=1 Tax=Saccostrea cuccullata TaxID=36930 RepID=UPI002ED598A4